MKKTILISLLLLFTMGLFSQSVMTKTKMTAKIKDKGDVFGNTIHTLEANHPIEIIAFHDSYCVVRVDTILGYTHEMNIVSTKETQQLKLLCLKNQLRIKLLEMYEKETVEKILDKKIWIGMTSQMTEFSIGKPEKINKTTTASGVREQWVYDNYDMYLYFENGKLVTIQE
ncbi:MAG: hypothetical protein JXL97_02355 [Bacteroidales bacterium]|nr:hypothetical protein [Bacteroidales bacterium]